MVRYDPGIRQDGKLPKVGRLLRPSRVGLLLAALGITTPAAAAPDVSTTAVPDPALARSAPVGNRLNGLFGSREFQSSNPAVVPEWDEVMRRIAHDAPEIAACDADPAACRSRRVRRWRTTVRDLQGADPLAQLGEINRFANRIVPYRIDRQVYRREDRWAAPLQMLRQAGDCEDYAILKFVSLLDLGFRNDQMRIVVVQDIVRDLAHAVLVVELDGRAFVLDNQFDELLPLGAVGRYRPYYSVNQTHHWTHLTLVADAGSPPSKSAKAGRMGLHGH